LHAYRACGRVRSIDHSRPAFAGQAPEATYSIGIGTGNFARFLGG
jgi:hypothetical protein